jgi:hypothetical protein
MKKKIIFGMVCLMLIIVSYIFREQRPEEQQTVDTKFLDRMDRILQESKEFCKEVRLTNKLLRFQTLDLMRSKNQEPEKWTDIGRMLANIEKANKLIKENEQSLEYDSFLKYPEKLTQLKEKFQEINALHKDVADCLTAIDPPKTLPALEI